MLSIIIPVYNEAHFIEDALRSLQPLRQLGVELIVVDGGSVDSSCSLAEAYVDKLLHAEKGRARQMNAGADNASGEMLLFLHIDTRLPDPNSWYKQLQGQTGWGFFKVRLSGAQYPFRLIESLMNLRSRLTGIATGDQCLFVDRNLFFKAGKFPEIPLMEDVAMSKRLKRWQRPACQAEVVITSSRRWQQNGIIKTIVEMWLLRFLYFIGVTPQSLVKIYYRDAKQ